MTARIPEPSIEKIRTVIRPGDSKALVAAELRMYSQVLPATAGFDMANTNE